jgi:N-methylhydantoinase A
MQAMAKRLGIADEYRMADGIVRIAVAKMVSSIREISVARGYDPREYTLVAFGGAGPMHATQIAADMGIPRVVVPPFAGAFSALGLVASDIRHDLVETVLVPVTDEAMAKVAHAHARQGGPASPTTDSRAARWRSSVRSTCATRDRPSS